MGGGWRLESQYDKNTVLSNNKRLCMGFEGRREPFGEGLYT